MRKEGDGLIAAFILDGKGGGSEVGWKEIGEWSPESGLLWVHLDYTVEQARKWLVDGSGLDEVISNALAERDSRPRCTSFHDGLLLSLRGVNLNPGSEPEDMVGIRIWFGENRIISTRRRRLLTVADLKTAVENGTGPVSMGDFLVQITGRLMERMSQVIEDLEDRVAELEEQLLTSETGQMRSQLSVLRRTAISLRRYLSPQREALSRLLSERLPWLDEGAKIELREVSDRLTRYVEDLDEARDRTAVTQEELANRLAEQMNSKMYLLSIIAAIFLPLGFLTGLLGINVGGIPGAESKMGFMLFVLLLVGVVGAQIAYFKKKKWF